MHIGVGGDSGADIDADGSGVDELYLTDSFRLDGADVLRQLLPVYQSLQAGDQGLQDQRCLAGAGYACDCGQLPLGDLCV